MKKFWAFLLVLGIFSLVVPGVAWAGRLWATGHDADYHCFIGQPQCHYLHVALNFVRGGAPDPTKKVLVLDNGSNKLDQDLTNLGIPHDTVDPSSPEFASTSFDVGRYSAIAVASDASCGGCDLNATPSATSQTPDSDAINARKRDITSFFNAGGGVLALAGASHGGNDPTAPNVYYNFLPLTVDGVAVAPPFCLTAAGRGLGLQDQSCPDTSQQTGTSPDINCCATHNSFTIPAAGGALGVAELDSVGKAETLVAQGTIAGGTTLPSRYVAMGDSYSSGEGTASYDDGTDTNTDKCHRSSHDLGKASYPPLLVRDSRAVPSTLTFVACSGATINDVLHGRYGEQPQINALGSDVGLVTISVGGDDLGFADVLANCVNMPSHDRSDEQCQGQESQIHQTMYVGDPAHGVPPLNARLIALYQKIRQLAPNARIIVMGYPHLFPLTGDNSCGFPLFRYLDSSNLNWLNKMSGELDTYIANAVAASGVAEYASTFNAMTDSSGTNRSACGKNPTWINELQLFHPFAFPYARESFHPNPDGYVAFEHAILATLNGPPGETTIQVSPGQTITQILTVGVGTLIGQLTVSIGWPGSDVTTSLVSPSGRVIDRNTSAPDVTRVAGATYEVYTITDPTPGNWTIRITGTSVAPAGEGVHILTALVKHQPIPPMAKASAHPSRGDAPLRVGFSAVGSHALEGRIRAYRWNFGDGTTGTGKRPHHTYTRSGRYSAKLTVINNSGATTFALTTVTVGPLAKVGPSGVIQLGSAQVGKHTRRQVVTITNPGSKPLVMQRIRVIRGARHGLRLAHDQCRGILSAHRSCTFAATFIPSALGPVVTEVAIVAKTGPVANVTFIASGGRKLPPTPLRTVTFAGDPANPRVTLDGYGFGTQPKATNLAHQGYTGYDYGNDLYLCDTSNDPKPFCAGQNDGSGAWDTIGLVITEYTDSQIAYSLGSDYSQSYYPAHIFRLQQGDSFTVHVKKSVCSGVVDFSGKPVVCT